VLAPEDAQLESLPQACASLWDAAFGGPQPVTPASLQAASAQLRACAVAVCEDMHRLCESAARGEGTAGMGSSSSSSSSSGGGGSGSGSMHARPEDALRAFREAVEGMAAQLAVLRQQEALAELVAHATGESQASGLHGAQAALARLQDAVEALPL
jgi:hypothetical protein